MRHMTLDEFDNELDGNDLNWRIVFNHAKQKFFVYRRLDRGDGHVISEYLQANGFVDNSCLHGWFSNYDEIGRALITHQDLIKTLGSPNTPSYGSYLDRFRPDRPILVGLTLDQVRRGCEALDGLDDDAHEGLKGLHKALTQALEEC